MGSKEGTFKVAAHRIGITYDEYMSKVDSGLKWCSTCKSWKSVTEFNRDANRSSGYSAKCRGCNYTRQTQGPTKRERAQKATEGLAWCRMCKEWLPMDRVHRGICRPHNNQVVKERYHSDPEFRHKVIQHIRGRKRAIKPLPFEGREILLEDFDGKCVYCGNPATTWDHIIPISKGGDTTPGNVVPACASCNSSKRDRNVFEWMDSKGIEYPEELLNRIILSFAGLYG